MPNRPIIGKPYRSWILEISEAQRGAAPILVQHSSISSSQSTRAVRQQEQTTAKITIKMPRNQHELGRMEFSVGTRDKKQVWCSEFDVAWRYVFNRCLQTLCFSSFTCGRHLPDDNVIRYTVNQNRTQFGCLESLVPQPYNRDKGIKIQRSLATSLCMAVSSTSAHNA